MGSTFHPPSHEEFDEQLRDLFRNGDQKGVCAFLGRDKGQLSKELNPEEPAESDFYRFARSLWACYCTRPELGASVWAFMEAFNSQFQAKPTALQTNSLLPELFDVMKQITLPTCDAPERVRLANKAIELFECLKVGESLKADEGQPAIRQVK